jgi:hypothetical protein
MPFLHGIRDTVIRDQAGTVLQEEPLKDGQSRRGKEKSGPRTVLYEDSLKGKRFRRGDGRSQNSTTA